MLSNYVKKFEPTVLFYFSKSVMFLIKQYK